MKKDDFVVVQGIRVARSNQAVVEALLAAGGNNIQGLAKAHGKDVNCLHVIASRARKAGLLPARVKPAPPPKKAYDGAPNRRPVIGISMRFRTEHYFASVAATEEHNFCQGSVLNCLKGRLKEHAGFEWRYATPAEIATHQLKARKAA